MEEQSSTSQPVPNTYVKGFHDDQAVFNMEYRPLGNTGLQVSVLSFGCHKSKRTTTKLQVRDKNILYPPGRRGFSQFVPAEMFRGSTLIVSVVMISITNLFISYEYIIKGASSLGSVFRKTNDSESMQVVHHALRSGINLIDTSPWYGHGKSENVLGQALKGIPRESYILTTKVGRYLPELDKMFDFSAKRVTRSIDESLERMGVSYIDIIQVHDLEFADSLDIIINETLPALEKAKEEGKAKFIGITGYPLEKLRTVIEKSKVHIDTVLTYCRCTMHDTELLDYLPFFKDHGVGIINASPISMGLLSQRGPPSWHPATKETRDKCQQAAEYCQAEGVDISKLAMHFTLGIKSLPTTLVSTASLENLKKNIASVNQNLTTKEEQVLEHVMNNIFKPCGNLAWEGIEVARYRKKLESTRDGQH